MIGKFAFAANRIANIDPFLVDVLKQAIERSKEKHKTDIL